MGLWVYKIDFDLPHHRQSVGPSVETVKRELNRSPRCGSVASWSDGSTRGNGLTLLTAVPLPHTWVSASVGYLLLSPKSQRQRTQLRDDSQHVHVRRQLQQANTFRSLCASRLSWDFRSCTYALPQSNDACNHHVVGWYLFSRGLRGPVRSSHESEQSAVRASCALRARLPRKSRKRNGNAIGVLASLSVWAENGPMRRGGWPRFLESVGREFLDQQPIGDCQRSSDPASERDGTGSFDLRNRMEWKMKQSSGCHFMRNLGTTKISWGSLVRLKHQSKRRDERIRLGVPLGVLEL